jgi:Family of unknown function (DUF6058)
MDEKPGIAELSVVRPSVRPADAEAGWAGYLSGEFGVCLRSVTPESMAAENHLVRRIEALVAAPAGTDPAWPSELRTTVDALDAPDRPFTDFDRQRWGETSRIRHIERVRARFPAAFGEARASATTATS